MSYTKTSEQIPETPTNASTPCAHQWHLPLKSPEVAEQLQELAWTVLDEGLLSVGCKLNNDEIAQAVTIVFNNDIAFSDLKETLLLAMAEQNLIGSCDTNQVPVPITEENWQESWKQYWKPQRLLPNLIVTPSWEDAKAQPNDIVIELDPGMAFGTGTHATTQLMLHLCHNIVCERRETRQPIKTALDVGTGSGILAFYLANLDVKSVVGIDNHDDAIIAAKKSALLNHLPKTSQELHFESTALENWQGPNATRSYDLILANILLGIIVENLPTLIRKLNAQGWLLLSGILATQWPQIQQALANYPELYVRNVSQQGEWIAIACQKA